MARTLLVAGFNSVSQNKGTTLYYPTGNSGLHAQFIEIGNQVTWHTPGKLSNLSIQVTANPITGNDSTLVQRINGVTVSQLTTIAAGTTGYFESIGVSDDVADGDIVNSMLTTGAHATTVTLLFTAIASVFEAFPVNAAYITSQRYISSSLSFDLSDGASYYFPLSYRGAAFTTEAHTEFRVNHAATWKNFYVYMDANGAGGSGSSLNLRQNGVTVIFIDPGAATGIFENTSTEVTSAVGDDFNFSFDSLNVGTTRPRHFSIESRSTDKTFHSVNGGFKSQNFGAISYMPLGGGGTSITTEANIQTKLQVNATISNLTGYVSSNTITA